MLRQRGVAGAGSGVTPWGRVGALGPRASPAPADRQVYLCEPDLHHLGQRSQSLLLSNAREHNVWGRVISDWSSLK